MAPGDATAADIPGRYDVAINGKGYRILDTIEPSLPFRSHRAIYGISPTFIERANISGAYGDNQQSFWLTYNQNDWTLGEQQKFFRPNGADADNSKVRYWSGSNVDLSIPGQVAIQSNVKSITFGGAAVGGCGVSYDRNKLYVVDSTNLYQVDGSGSITTLSAHGAGAPFPRAVVSDGLAIYIQGATPLIRKWDILGATMSTFSSSGTSMMALGFLNNTLYGIDSGMSTLYKFDTGGNPTSVYTWKGADGANRGYISNLKGWGGDLAIIRCMSENGQGAELWQYDGNGVSALAQFPPNFFVDQMEVVNGVIMIAGAFRSVNATKWQSGIFYYANGNFGLLWKANATSTNLTIPSLCAFQDGLVFTDETLGSFMFYNPGTGGVSTIGSFTPGNSTFTNTNANMLFAAGTQFGHIRQATGAYFFPDSVKATSATVTSSLYDFDSSLNKLFRGVTVAFNLATDGNGGSVDIYYQLNSLDGAFTLLKSGATSGTEYIINQSAQSISIQVVLNQGTSTLGPVLKRVYVRAAPQLQTYRFRTYVLDLSGIGWKDPVKLLDGTYHPLSGHEQAANLLSTFQSTTPFSITDRFSTFTGICDISPSASNPAGGCEIYEMREGNDDPNFSGGFAAKITLREV